MATNKKQIKPNYSQKFRTYFNNPNQKITIQQKTSKSHAQLKQIQQPRSLSPEK